MGNNQEQLPLNKNWLLNNFVVRSKNKQPVYKPDRSEGSERIDKATKYYARNLQNTRCMQRQRKLTDITTGVYC